MAVYKPKRKGTESKYYVYEFVYQGKRCQGSTGVSTKTAAKKSPAEFDPIGRGVACERSQNSRECVVERFS